MTDDLVTRLRDASNPAWPVPTPAQRLFTEAADALDAQTCAYNLLAADAARFCGDNERLLKAVSAMTVEEALGRIQTLRDALERSGKMAGATLVDMRRENATLRALLAEVWRYLDDPSAPEWEVEGIYNYLIARLKATLKDHD